MEGLTPVDSLYEYAGARLAAQLGDVAWSFGLPAILALAGLAYVVHASLERGTLRDAAVYVFYLMLIGWLLAPASVAIRTGGATLRERLDLENRGAGELQVPRFVALLGSGTGRLQRKSVESIHREFLSSPFERERLMAAADAAEVFDGMLRSDLWQFGRHCWRPAVASDTRANAELGRLDPLARGAYRYAGLGPVQISNEGRPHESHPLDCEKAREWLEDRVERHLKNDPFHRRVLDGLLGRSSPPVNRDYRAAVVRRAMLGARTPSQAGLLLQMAFPERAQMERAKQLHAVEESGGAWDGLNLMVSWVVDRTATAKQSVDTAYTTRQKLYIATLQGPYLYGLALLIVTGLFPVVGLVAILPGRWRALVNYGKVYLSIKLWPVCWAALTKFQARAPDLDVFGDPVHASELVTVVASMYLLTPAFCFAVVSLATSVTALPFGSALPTPAGSAAGAVVTGGRAVLARK